MVARCGHWVRVLLVIFVSDYLFCNCNSLLFIVSNLFFNYIRNELSRNNLAFDMVLLVRQRANGKCCDRKNTQNIHSHAKRKQTKKAARKK